MRARAFIVIGLLLLGVIIFFGAVLVPQFMCIISNENNGIVTKSVCAGLLLIAAGFLIYTCKSFFELYKQAKEDREEQEQEQPKEDEEE